MTDKSPQFAIGLTEEAINQVRKLHKWASFLSALGFVNSAVLILLGLGMGPLASYLGKQSADGTNPVLSGIPYVVIGVWYFFPCFFLRRFTSSTKASLDTFEPGQFAVALKHLKSCVAFIGMSAIILIGTLLVGIAVAVVISVLR